MSPSEHPQALRQTYRLRNGVISLDTRSEAITFRYSSNILAQISKEESNYPYGMNLVGYSTSIGTVCHNNGGQDRALEQTE
jgi:hypothetical protein